jgi:hypothetical protein
MHTISCQRHSGDGARGAFFAATLSLAWASTASAYVGDSFLNIPSSPGHWQGEEHKAWIRAEANEWVGVLRRLNSGATDPLAGDKLFFGAPGAVRSGNGGKLNITLGKGNPDVAQLLARCKSKEPIPEMTYAESSDRSRPVLELGPRPAQFPAYWEYKLKDVQVVGCPVVADAMEQAFILSFDEIEWLNYDPEGPRGNKIVVKPEDLPNVKPAAPSAGKKVKAFLITWIAPATDASEDQCPVMNSKPTEADVFRYLSKDEIAKARAKNGEKGITFGGQTEARGPLKLNAVLLPGIVPDPGFREPQSRTALGIDLDGNDGSGAPPAGVCKHKNYVSADGRAGIDNQYLSVVGCVAGFRGKQGYRNQTSNARRADGNITTLIEISGIDDEKNDDSVEVAFIYAKDKPIRDNAGSKFIPNYTFRPTDNPNFALYNRRVHGRIVNGVISTDPTPNFQMNLGQDPLLELLDARMRFEILQDGSLKGVLAGYRDWREIASSNASGYSEGLFGYQLPGLFYALKRNADGLKDPVTGECNGISTVYEIDGIQSFLAPAPPEAKNVADVSNDNRKAQ